MKDLIKRLSGLHAISGFEYRINSEIKSILEEYSDEVTIDNLGSVIALRKSKNKDAKNVLIEAHIDEIGLMVKKIDENGFITFANVGGVDQRILPAREVVVHGKRDVKGVIGVKPPHITSVAEEKKCYSINDLTVDTGLSKEEVFELIRVGDAITFDVSPRELLDGQITGKSLDDRACVATLIDALKNLKDCELNVNLYVVASAKEEVGGYGAMTAAYKINPDLAIAVDVCHGITPDNSDFAYEVGSGAVITCGPNINPLVFERLISTAKENDIKYEIDVDGGNTGTDAWEMQIIREGIPTGLLSVPLKYMHTAVEVISVSDCEVVSSLIQKFILGLNGKEEWICY